MRFLPGLATSAICACVSHLAGAESACTVDAAFTISPESTENQRFPAVAYGEGVHLVVWQEGWNGAGGNAQIVGTLVRAGAGETPQVSRIAKRIEICLAQDHQEAPQVAFANGVFLVAWHDFRNGKDADIYGARVSIEGKVLDTDGIPIASRSHNQNFPVVCGNGRDFLVMWREAREDRNCDLYATRIESRTGKVLDEKGVGIASEAALPAAAFDGKHYVLAWLDSVRTKKLQFCRYDPDNLERVDASPVTLGHPDAFGSIGQLKLIAGSNEVLALWARGLQIDPWGWNGPGAILSMRIKSDGTTPENLAFNKLRWSPEGRSRYVDRVLPGVLDTARWKGLQGWPQGKPGGFKEAEDGIWPYAYLTGVALPEKQGQYAAAWVRMHLDGLYPTGILDLAGGRLRSDASLEVPDYPPMDLVKRQCVMFPSLSAGASGEPLLLVYEQRNDEGLATIQARFVRMNPIP